MTDTAKGYTYWVCVDCYYAHHGLDTDADSNNTCEPLSDIPTDAEVTSGLLLDEHGDWCDEDARDSGQCECEQVTFSWATCDGCRSHLGGTRHALTVWE